MSQGVKRSAKDVPIKRTRRTPAPALLPLPAATTPTSLTPVTAISHPVRPASKKRDRTVLPSNSLVRQKVLAIIAMRLEGRPNEEIATTLGIKESSIRQYMFLAGKNGWLSKKAVDPTDRLEYEIAHKVVRNLDEMLDSDNEARRDNVTLKTAEGMLFKRFAEATNQLPALTQIGIRIEMPTGAPIEVREGTTGGVSRWTDAESTPHEQPA